MDIFDYVRDKEKRLSEKTKSVRDAKVFDFNYIPKKPLLRNEVKAVIDALLRYEKTGIANHALIVGSRGSGKTLSVRFLEQLFKSRGIRMLYANCRSYNSSYKVLARLLGVRARGVSFDELAERFSDTFQDKTVVVLDEVDLLSEKDTQKNILYFLSRSPNNYMTLLLSNNPRWNQVLDESIQSTLQPELLHFRPYTAQELSDILRVRARLGLRKTPETVIRKIAAMTAKFTESDVRIAIKTLYYWATESDVSLETNFQRARRDVVYEVVRHLSDKNLLILRAVFDREMTVKEAYQGYRRLCAQLREEPFSYVYFFASLSYLQSLGLVLLVSTKIRRTYAKAIQLTFPTDVLGAVWKARFG